MGEVGNVGHDEIRRLLAEELALESPPPIGDLVEKSVRRGRRMRRTRGLWTAGGAGGVALASLILIVLLVAEPAPHGRTGATRGIAASPPVAGSGTAPGAVPAQSASAAPVPAPSAPPAVTGPQVKATTRGMLELLSTLLPAGKRTMPAQTSDGSLFVALNLDRGQGVGMVRLNVDSTKVPVSHGPCMPGSICQTLPDGNYVEIIDIPDNCIERHAVFLTRPDGISVGMLMSSCLSWNGSDNPPGQVVLSVEEAIAIADDPRWGTTMPKSLVDRGQRDFPNLSTFS
jgi:hypothetical protein